VALVAAALRRHFDLASAHLRANWDHADEAASPG
jgi:hypothetical protein